MAKQLISSGTAWEKKFGYSRAVKMGNRIFVAGTTAVNENGEVIGEGSLYEQTIFVFKKIERALKEAGATMNDVVRIRTFITDISKWEEAAKAQGEIFSDIRPAATLVAVAALVCPELLVEIEADAVIEGE